MKIICFQITFSALLLLSQKMQLFILKGGVFGDAPPLIELEKVLMQQELTVRKRLMGRRKRIRTAEILMVATWHVLEADITCTSA